MTARPRILVCDDEPDLREIVGDYLKERGFDIVEAEDAEQMHAELAKSLPDLALLDINLPGEDGLTALRRLRTQYDVPVIMLTAAADVIDRVVGLEMGADDYLGKPVDLRELEARIKAALRRRPALDAIPSTKLESVKFGACELDLASVRLLDENGAEINITAMEFSLLKVFSENRGRVLDRSKLLDLAHDKPWEPFDRSIDLRISRIRRKIEPNPEKPEIIRTVHGVGYIFD